MIDHGPVNQSRVAALAEMSREIFKTGAETFVVQVAGESLLGHDAVRRAMTSKLRSQSEQK